MGLLQALSRLVNSNRLNDVTADAGGALLASGLRQYQRYPFAVAAEVAQNWTVTGSLAGTETLDTVLGELSVTLPAAAGADWLLISTRRFTLPLRVMIGCNLSAKVAGHDVEAGIVSINSNTGLPDWSEYAALAWDSAATSSTSNTRARTCGRGILQQSSTVTVGTSIGVDQIRELICDPESIVFAGRAPNSTAARGGEMLRDGLLPDATREYAVYVRAVTSGTPASTAVLKLQWGQVVDHTEQQVEITGGRGTSMPAQAVPVNGIMTVSGTAVVTPTPSASSGGFSTNTLIVSAATNNAAVIAAAAAGVGGIVASNSAASWRYVKFYNKSSAPAPATDTPFMVVPVPPGGTVVLPQSFHIRFSTGLGIAIVAGAANNDNTAVGAGEVIVNIQRI